jgi:hypothetical protein
MYYRRARWETLAGDSGFADSASEPLITEESQGLGEPTTIPRSRAKSLVRPDLGAAGGKLEDRVRVPNRQDDPPGANSMADRENAPTAIQHCQVERET